jgi:hypothetical protein
MKTKKINKRNKKKCSGKGCDVKYIKNDYVFCPNLCVLCKKHFCINCMGLSCKICHINYLCWWCGCGFEYKKGYIQKCPRHVNLYEVRCEEINCTCKNISFC